MSDGGSLRLEFPRTGAAPRFLMLAGAWILGLFALLRAPWLESRILTPLAGVQEMIAGLGLDRPPRVLVTLDCAGADVMALCAGVLLAFPVAWRRRFFAASLSLVWIFFLNSVRIGVLERVAGTAAFDALHLYLLPILIQLGAAGYVSGWIWRWTRETDAHPSQRRLSGTSSPFFVVAVVLLVVYALVTPTIAGSAFVAGGVGALAAVAAYCLNLLGQGATATGDLLTTPQGSFLVTAECVLTPLMPVALAGALTWRTSASMRALLVLSILPLFVGLNLARLLVLALPVWLFGGPLFAAHGLRQAVAGGVCLVAACLWRREASQPVGVVTRRILTSILVGSVAGFLLAPILVRGLLFLVTLTLPLAPHALTELRLPGDEQSGLASLPAFQIGLLAGLLFARKVYVRWSLGVFAALIGFELVLLVGLGELGFHRGVEPSPLLVRALAVVVPLILAFSASKLASSRSYKQFWHDVGAQFPDLGGAASTDFYRANEIRLIREHFGDLKGRRVFKTDLWDEARNTRILQWVSSQGALVFGADISAPTLRLARDGFEKGALLAAQGDVRWLPFGEASFDLVYSMGTIEHFADSRGAAAEIRRVLKPGGLAIVGVPNRRDPFLRPLLVSALSAVGLYDYGYERSFSRPEIAALLESVGFEVVAEPAILFIPGWLRMLDLWCHCRFRPLTRITAPLVSVFVWLDRRFKAVRRHGYLLATVARRPLSV